MVEDEAVFVEVVVDGGDVLFNGLNESVVVGVVDEENDVINPRCECGRLWSVWMS